MCYTVQAWLTHVLRNQYICTAAAASKQRTTVSRNPWGMVAGHAAGKCKHVVSVVNKAEIIDMIESGSSSMAMATEPGIVKSRVSEDVNSILLELSQVFICPNKYLGHLPKVVQRTEDALYPVETKPVRVSMDHPQCMNPNFLAVISGIGSLNRLEKLWMVSLLMLDQCTCWWMQFLHIV